MIWITRIALLFLFAVFWGGLTFYTGIVVRISHDVLNDPIDGGLITQRVTDILQWLAVGCCVLMFVNAIVVTRTSSKWGVALLVCSALFAVSIGALMIVHGLLDATIDTQAAEVIDRDAFTTNHRRYNQWTTLEWISCLVYLPVTVFAWRACDRRSSSKT